ncbi:glycoside hydrolase family 5 protein [Aureliella helgolandensis]|uniref:Endoglucanase C307 n=1 Tax=Aureliella helgolandensis TaxID=2527968 RepID=A0A518G5B4_9BACT|nr:cellulase family glycosylhydrolase [Aureliella helgolandensis]QDV23784.1 Endoglucanase C307 precursor [Aureliella helgolandensis]
MSILLTFWVASGLQYSVPSLAQSVEVARSASLPRATAAELPRWRGFNLLEKFHKDWSNQPFVEDDFRMIHELGFNFVRLPLDYRIWTDQGDWNQFDESQLQEIDRAVNYGHKYGIHVCINFHRAPGYTVASPPEPTDLWTDTATQAVCKRHWATFAKRYRGIPNEQLSFNLFNEPPEDVGAAFYTVVREVVAAIRAEDPQRLIISDGLAWGLKPVYEFADLNIAQATRGYTPFELTHYQASWVADADRFPVPQWPQMKAYGLLVSETKPDIPADQQRTLVIKGTFSAPTSMRLRVGTVSTQAVLVVTADGSTIFEKTFTPGPGLGEWKEASYQAQWDNYQNLYDRDYRMSVPAGTQRIVARVVEGDWLTVTELGLRSEDTDDSREHSIAIDPQWGQSASTITYSPQATPNVFLTEQLHDRQWLYDSTVLPWFQAKEKGIGVVVGEFGCFNRTPHEVTLAWMEDALANWKRCDMGWALWNFRGSFGVLDSERTDVEYENFQGHLLDRKMLELLQRY